jgi:hypothetical protein
VKEVPGVPWVLVGPSPVAGEAAGGELAVVPVAVPWSWPGTKRRDGWPTCR